MEPHDDLHGLLEELAHMSTAASPDTTELLEELQRAVAEHHKILERQGDLIRRLRAELKDVRRDDRRP